MRRTTVRIDDELLRDAKGYAARHGRSLNSVMEDALRQLLQRSRQSPSRERVDLTTSGNEDDEPLVDVSPEGLRQLLADEEIDRYLRVERDEATRR